MGQLRQPIALRDHVEELGGPSRSCNTKFEPTVLWWERSRDLLQQDGALNTQSSYLSSHHHLHQHKMSTPFPALSSSEKWRCPLSQDNGEGSGGPDPEDLEIRPPSAPPPHARSDGQDFDNM